MLPLERPERIKGDFDDHRLVANAGLMLTLRLGLGELADRCLDLGCAPGRAHTGDKLMTLVASALAGGDCIDDSILGNSALDRLANASFQIVIEGASYREKLSPHRKLMGERSGD